MKKLLFNSSEVKLPQALVIACAFAYNKIFSLAEAKPLPVIANSEVRQGLASRFWMRLACLCEGIGDNDKLGNVSMELSDR